MQLDIHGIHATGLEIIKKNKNPLCFVVSYANSQDVGYVPTKEAYKKGGYEIDNAYKNRLYKAASNASDFFIKESGLLLKNI